MFSALLLVILTAAGTVASTIATTCMSEYGDYSTNLESSGAFSADQLALRRHLPTNGQGGDGWLINPLGQSIVFSSARTAQVRRFPTASGLGPLGEGALRAAAGSNFSHGSQILASVAPYANGVRFFVTTNGSQVTESFLDGYCGDNVAIVDQFRTGRFYLFCANSSHLVDATLYSYGAFESPLTAMWRPRDRATGHLVSPQLGIGHPYDIVLLAGGRAAGVTPVDWLDVFWFDRQFPRALGRQNLTLSTPRYDVAVSSFRRGARSLEFLVAGGLTANGKSALVDHFACSYNSSITRFDVCNISSLVVPPLSQSRGGITAIQFGLITVFAGGFDASGDTYTEIDVYERVDSGFIARTLPWDTPFSPEGIAFVGPLHGLNLAVLTPSGMEVCAAWPFQTTRYTASDLTNTALAHASSVTGINTTAFAYGALVPVRHDPRSVWVADGLKIVQWSFPAVNEGSVAVNQTLVSDMLTIGCLPFTETNRGAASMMGWVDSTIRIRWGTLVSAPYSLALIGAAFFNSTMPDVATNEHKWVDVLKHQVRSWNYPFGGSISDVKIVPGAAYVQREGSPYLYVLGGVDYNGGGNRNASMLYHEDSLSTGIIANRTWTLAHAHVLGAAVQTTDGTLWHAGGFFDLPQYEDMQLTVSSAVHVYRSSLTLQHTVDLSVARFSLAGVAVKNQAFFIGGATSFEFRERGYRMRDMSRVVDVFTLALTGPPTRYSFELLHTGGLVAASVMYERFIVIVGGGHARADAVAGSNVIEILDVQTGESMLMHGARNQRFAGHNAVVTPSPAVMVVACTTAATLMFDSPCNHRVTSVIDLSMLNSVDSARFDNLPTTYIMNHDRTCAEPGNTCTSLGYKTYLPYDGEIKCVGCMSIQSSMRFDIQFALLGTVFEPQLLFRAGTVLRGRLALDAMADYEDLVAHAFVPSIWLGPGGASLHCNNDSTIIPITGWLPSDRNHTISIRIDQNWRRVAFNGELHTCPSPNPTALELRERFPPAILNSFEIGGTSFSQTGVAIYYLVVGQSVILPTPMPPTTPLTTLTSTTTATTTTATTSTSATTTSTTGTTTVSGTTGSTNTSITLMTNASIASTTSTESTASSTISATAGTPSAGSQTTIQDSSTSSASAAMNSSSALPPPIDATTTGTNNPVTSIVEVAVVPDWVYVVAVGGALLIVALVILVVCQASRRNKRNSDDVPMVNARDEMASARDDSRDSGEYARLSTIVPGGTMYAPAPNPHTGTLQDYALAPAPVANGSKEYALAPAPAIVPDYVKAPPPGVAVATKKRSRRAQAGAQQAVQQDVYAAPTVEASGVYETAPPPPGEDSHNPYGTVLVKPYDQVRAEGGGSGDYVRAGVAPADYGSSARVPLPNNYDMVTTEMKAEGNYKKSNAVPPPPPLDEDEEA